MTQSMPESSETKILDLAQGLDQEALGRVVDRLRQRLPHGNGNGTCGLKDRFQVPEDVRCLTTAQLELLDRTARSWVESAGTPATARARKRLLLLYLLLRHSGARLGEVLALDEREAFDFDGSTVSFAMNGGREPRKAVMPREVMAGFRRALDQPDMLTLRGQVFHLDQGYVRRKFYELADMAGLPRDRVNPTSIRNSRAVELLRGGTPLVLLQEQLGCPSLESASAFVTYPDEVARRILSECIQENFPMKTSARNTFAGVVDRVRSAGILCEVTMKTTSGLEVVSIITNRSREALDIGPGRPVTAMVKAPWVLVSDDADEGEMSARNRYKARVTDIHGDGLAVEVSGELEDGTTMCALITGTSVDKLGLVRGEAIHFFFKAMNVILTAD